MIEKDRNLAYSAMIYMVDYSDSKINHKKLKEVFLSRSDSQTLTLLKRCFDYKYAILKKPSKKIWKYTFTNLY